MWYIEPECTKLDCSEPHHVKPNQGLQHHVRSVPLWYITQHTVVIPYPSSNINKSKTEQSMTEGN